MLEKLEEELDLMVERWARTLLSNLEDPASTRVSAGSDCPLWQLIEDFIKERKLPDDPSQAFLDALSEALSGLTKVQVKTADLHSALLKGGSPATLDEMKKRFEEYLDILTKGREAGKVRIVLE